MDILLLILPKNVGAHPDFFHALNPIFLEFVVLQGNKARNRKMSLIKYAYNYLQKCWF